MTNLGLRTRRHGTRAEAESVVDTPLVYPARRSDPDGISVRHLEGAGLRGVTSTNRGPMSRSVAPPTDSSGTLSLIARLDHFD
jgi:hypothetical protein